MTDTVKDVLTALAKAEHLAGQAVLTLEEAVTAAGDSLTTEQLTELTATRRALVAARDRAASATREVN